MAERTLARVGAGGLAGHAERPVGGLQGQQLAQRARRRVRPRWRARAAPPRAPATRAPRPAARSRSRDRAARPSSSSGSSAGAGAASTPASAASSGNSSTPADLTRLDHRRQPVDPLVPEVPEQLGVERADREPAAREPARRRLGEVARVRADLLGRARRVVRRAVDRPRRVAVLGVVARVAVGRRATGSRCCATRGPSARGRSARAAGRRRCAAGAAARASPWPSTSVRSTHDGVHAGLLQQRVEPRRVPALRQPEAAVPSARSARGARRCRRSTWSRTPAAVASSGSTAWVADDVHARVRRERADEVASARLEALGRARVQTPPSARARAPRRGPRPRRCRAGASPPAPRAGTRGSARGRRRPSSWSHSTGVSESVIRPGWASSTSSQRQVGGRHRLPQPLLAERPRPEALHVGHVGVQDDAEAAAHGRRTARKSSARSRSVDRSAKSRTEMAGVKRS